MVYTLCAYTLCHHVHNQWKTRHILSEVHINKQINHKPRCHGYHRKIYHIYKLKDISYNYSIVNYSIVNYSIVNYSTHALYMHKGAKCPRVK